MARPVKLVMRLAEPSFSKGPRPHIVTMRLRGLTMKDTELVSTSAALCMRQTNQLDMQVLLGEDGSTAHVAKALLLLQAHPRLTDSSDVSQAADTEPFGPCISRLQPISTASEPSAALQQWQYTATCGILHTWENSSFFCLNNSCYMLSQHEKEHHLKRDRSSHLIGW